MSARKSFAAGKPCISFAESNGNQRVGKNKFSGAGKRREETAKLVKYIDESVIGKNTTFTGPYGRRKVVYCDYAASGRSLQFIEDYIVREVLPNCGHVRSTTSITSLQSILFRHEAREIFRLCVNATNEDSVIFSGHGCRGPINKLLQELNFCSGVSPVVFVGSCEHQSAILPWKEMGAKVIRISESKEGFIDLNDLENQLIAHRGCGKQMIGCFSAANNLTGILADEVATTLMLHQHGALAFWDYTTAAPYVQLDMNPKLPGVEESAVHKDAMFFSAHKFIGGVQTPGILIAKKFLLRNSKSSEGVESPNAENKENGHHEIGLDVQDDRGTATIVEDVRAGMVMHLKEAVGIPAIMSKEEKISRTVLAHVKNIPEFVLLGNSSHSLKRLPFFSFIVRHPRGMFLHHNFVCSVLNDVFGIQARGGCAGPGPYFQDFMGIDSKLAEDYERILNHSHRDSFHEKEDSAGLEILRPGFTRISLPFFISDAELGFVLEALKMVATEGWKLLPQYILRPSTGEWRHHSNSVFRDRKWLGSLKYIDGRLVVPERKISAQGTNPVDYEECLHVARCIFNRARKIAQRYPLAAQKFTFTKEAEPLRWFMLPSEAHDLLIGNSQNVRHRVPFNPNRYNGCKGDPVSVDTAFSKDSKRVSSAPSMDKVAGDVGEISQNSQCNLQPNLPSYLSFERQNSFSSEISNSDSVDSPAGQRVNRCYPSTGATYSPAANCPVDVLCYSPQPPVLSHVPNMDRYSPQMYHHHHQPSYVPQKSYVGPVDTSLYVDPNGLKSVPPVGDRFQYGGKVDTTPPVNKVHFLLGRNDPSTRQRCNSLGSSVILHPRNRVNPGYSCRSLTDGEGSLNLSECSLSSNEDIHAYVTEVTKELATEIKSEIREVISKVEDVLSNESLDVDNPGYNHLGEHRGSKCYEQLAKCEKLERTNSLPSASANDIAQYLMGVSKEMAEEMKSEIRGLVSSVVSPDSSPMWEKKEKKVTIEDRRDRGRKSEMSSVMSTENISQSRDSGINLSYCENPGVDARVGARAKDPEEKKFEEGGGSAEKGDGGSPERDRSESLDSFKESGLSARCRSESFDSLQENEDSDAAGKTTATRRRLSRALKKAEKTKSRGSGESSNDEEFTVEDTVKPRWQCPSKPVWKPTVEALKEFEMVQNGDRILVSLCGVRNSLAILHTLQQYKYYASSRGINFEFGAATSPVDAKGPNENAKALLSYLEGLEIPCFFLEEEEDDDEEEEEGCTGDKAEPGVVDPVSICAICSKWKRSQLYALAAKQNFNVIALCQNFDDLAAYFLLSAFHNGKLRTMKAHYYIPTKDIRVIRPFVYVREKALRQFVESRNLPAAPENCASCRSSSREKQRSKQLLCQQEFIFPRLFSSLKAALHPLISQRYADAMGRMGKYATDSDETSLT